MNKLPRLNRRTVLRGLGGTAIALPFLEIMTRSSFAATSNPLRYCVLFGSFSLTPDDDTRANLIVPDMTGANYDLKDGLKPLAGVQQHVTVVSNLTMKAVASPDASDGIPIHWHNDALFAGGSKKQGGQNIVYTHPTTDQIVADAIGTTTPIKSLAYRVQASQYVTGSGANANQGTMSARKDSSGKIMPITPNASPKAAFDSLFSGLMPGGGGGSSMPTPATDIALVKRRSVLDLVDRSMGGLKDKLSKTDQARLIQHWDEIRALENRIADVSMPTTPPPSAGSVCNPFADPGADPAVGGSLTDPNGYDANLGYSDEEARAKVFTDLVAMAFACDLTRSASLMHTFVESFMNAKTIANVDRTVHDAHHQGGPTVEKIGRICAWHMKHYASLIDKLSKMPEGNGSVLDNSMLVYMIESGMGIDSNGIPNSHSGDKTMAVLAGGAGGFKRGIHLVAPSDKREVANLYTTAMAAVGVNVSSVGDISSSEIPGLRG